MKVNCLYHNEQLITNFCRDIHCLMPLCPQCISEHTQYHEQERTRPKYTTIYEVMADAHAQITNCMEQLEHDKKKNQNLMTNIQTIGDKVREKIRSVKQIVRKAIDQSFLMLQKQISRQLEKYHEERSIYSMAKSQREDQLISEYLDQLHVMRSTLKSQKGISNIIYFFREKLQEIDNFHTQFASYIQSNENYHPKIQINNEALHSLESVIARIIKLGNHVPQKKRKVVEPLHDHPQNIVLSPIRYSVQNKMKEKANVQFVQSQVGRYSPQRSTAAGYSRQKNVVKMDGDYEKMSKKVEVLRQQNNKLSRLLISGGQQKK